MDTIEKQIESIVEKAIVRAFQKVTNFANSKPDFELDRLTQTQAAKLAGISIPTLKKEIRAGKFKEYELGRKRYLLKSEVLDSLRNSNL